MKMDTIMFVSYKTYYTDLKVIDERLSRLEHIIDLLTKQKVEELK
jgi:hypothetical protein